MATILTISPSLKPAWRAAASSASLGWPRLSSRLRAKRTAPSALRSAARPCRARATSASLRPACLPRTVWDYRERDLLAHLGSERAVRATSVEGARAGAHVRAGGGNPLEARLLSPHPDTGRRVRRRPAKNHARRLGAHPRHVAQVRLSLGQPEPHRRQRPADDTGTRRQTEVGGKAPCSRASRAAPLSRCSSWCRR